MIPSGNLVLDKITQRASTVVSKSLQTINNQISEYTIETVENNRDDQTNEVKDEEVIDVELIRARDFM